MKKYKITYPGSVGNNEGAKLSILTRLNELLKDEWNAKSQDFQNGTITQAEWDAYLDEYRYRRDAVWSDMGANMDVAKTGPYWTQINLSNIEAL